MKRKIILAVADGIGDRPCEELNGMTPLEFAHTPNLDRYAKDGATGIVDVLSPGVPVGTDLGHMILFGFQPDDYPGRGPIEAAGAGIRLMAGDVALRCNFATVDEDGHVVDRRAGRIRKDTSKLAEVLNGKEIEGVQILFKEATEHRCVLVLRGPGLSSNISDSDPKTINGKTPSRLSKALDESEAAEKTARVLNKFIVEAHNILKNHPINKNRLEEGLLPANFLLLRGAGQMPELTPISEKYGFKGACVAAEGTVLGVARIAGYDTYTHENLTGNLDTDIEMKASLIKEALKYNDFVAVNVKAPDLMGHDNKPKEKAKAIEMFDHLFDYLQPEDMENTILAVLGDHSTPCERGEHSGDPVPLLLYGSGIRKDRSRSYGEVECSHGGNGRIKGTELIQTLFDYMEKTKKQGN